MAEFIFWIVEIVGGGQATFSLEKLLQRDGMVAKDSNRR